MARIMAEVNLSIAGHSYTVACRDGEEDRLTKLGKMVDAKTVDAQQAVGGNIGEARVLLLRRCCSRTRRTSCARMAAFQQMLWMISRDLPTASRRLATILLRATNPPRPVLAGAARYAPLQLSLRRYNIQGSCHCPDLGPVHMVPIWRYWRQRIFG